ncbi:MAG: energy transducer TonB [Thiobacillus sp. GWE1_62_9]|nr:MAG: energy transducer TonB [Thiobacillus sp. GWE1_62_9]
MTPPFDEPTIPPKLQRPLAAVWISLGLHAAVIALVQVVPPTALGVGAPVIEARLVPTHVAAPSAPEPLPATPAVDTPDPVPMLAPSETDEALPVAEPMVPPASPPEPSEPSAVAASAAPPAPAAAPPSAFVPVPAATMTSAVDLTYYSARDLDVHPRALREIVPEYPAEADRQRLSGTVRLQLKLEADGRVSDVEVVSASPPGRFEDSAVRAFRDARFAPAQKNGRPVRALVLIEVEYDWEGRR